MGLGSGIQHRRPNDYPHRIGQQHQAEVGSQTKKAPEGAVFAAVALETTQAAAFTFSRQPCSSGSV